MVLDLFCLHVHSRKICCIIMMMCLLSRSYSQSTLNIKIVSTPTLHREDSIFIAGDFNNWDPGSKGYHLLKSGDTLSISLAGIEKGIHQFKFTRGSWNNVEVTATGSAIENRLVRLTADTTVMYTIEAWGDDFARPEPKHTASENVQVMDTAFYMPQLLRYRKIWVYLPPGYATSKKRYPVVYMHDGQNLFDNVTSGFGEWGVDEWLDSLSSKSKQSCIVVGIESGEHRMTEYNPFDTKQFGKGEGKEYVHFLVQTLKPFIDKKYRTMPSTQNTVIAGSSLGGLISYYAALHYPKVFGKAGVFSPSFWIAPQIKHETDSLGENLNGQYFFLAGAMEGDNMVSDMLEVSENLGERSRSLIYSIVDPNGRHNEQMWRKWFGEFYLWIQSNGFSYQINIGN